MNAINENVPPEVVETSHRPDNSDKAKGSLTAQQEEEEHSESDKDADNSRRVHPSLTRQLDEVSAAQTTKQTHKSIHELDDISTQIMLRLTKHLGGDEGRVQELLKDSILKKVVGTRHGRKEFQVISAVSLFGTLRTVDVLPYEEGKKDLDIHGNLTEYLLVDSKMTLSVKRLQKAIKFFANDPEMQKRMESIEERKEHDDVIKKELGKKYDYDEEVAVDSSPNQKNESKSNGNSSNKYKDDFADNQSNSQGYVAHNQ